MPNAQKSLPALHEEWENCTSCELGLRRSACGGRFVPGEGVRRGVMFIGEGPGETEEEMGVPFVGSSGKILRKIIEKLGIKEHYITNVVACRSCSPILDAEGLPRMRRAYKGKPALPMLKDEPPLPKQIEACLPRVHEEIYLVDPVVIVTLGATASAAILKRHVSITRDRGQTEHCAVPGVGFHPVRTEKKDVWLRKIHGKMELPVERNEVMYEVVPTIHPAYVLRRLADQGADSPFRQLVGDIRLAVKIYERYMLEAFGKLPSVDTDVPDEVIQEDLEVDEN